MVESQLSTGIAGLDRMLKGLIPGDNVVWQVERIEDFVPFVEPYCDFARRAGRRLVYFRFADHEPLVPEAFAEATCRLDTAAGFEQFLTEIHRVVRQAGRGAFFVFDCLSTLSEAWHSDRMLGNFFRLTCPYVFDLESLAYFPLLRNYHSRHAAGPIAETTQILLDVHRHRGTLHLQPTKVQHRYSPTMYMLHACRGDDVVPVSESSTIAEILAAVPWAGLESVRLRLGKWNRMFLEAEQAWELLQRGDDPQVDLRALRRTLLCMVFTRDERLLKLAERYLTLGDVLGVWKRMIGTGLIGGKAVGMLLARAILRQTDARWAELLEAHDSFFIGSDVFYSFLVENGCWWLRQRQRDPETFLDGVEEARHRILLGSFPDSVVAEFAEMLDYFGQSPIIVRSSSLLEDAYGNAFAGKYESVFCANQGPHQKRLQDFLSAVKTIYASSMSEKALRYRAQRGLLDRDEQMSLLVQRVSGKQYGSFFFPQVAGVALSVNPYVWNKCIDPAAGMVRLVFGLGTRAVDRSDDDYTRVVALNEPTRRPESDAEEIRQYSQRRVDVIDLDASQLVSYEFSRILERNPDLPVELFADEDRELARLAAESNLPAASAWLLTFDSLLSETPFVADMREMLSILHGAYEYPVDLEFTANFFHPPRYQINLVQCRPLQVAAAGAAAELPERVEPENLVLEASGAVVGPSRLLGIQRLIYVVPDVYAQLTNQERYATARLIGKLMHLKPRPAGVMLVGPGRWGTTTPSLGVPVAFAEIDKVSVLCEIVAMRDDLVPDVSLGTHFFNDLVESDILYLALFPGRKGNAWNREFLEGRPNRLAELLPDAANWSHLVRVIDFPLPSGDGGPPSGDGDSAPMLKLCADSLEQRVVCFLDHGEAAACEGGAAPAAARR
jgi:pyruvate, water dikinase